MSRLFGILKVILVLAIDFAAIYSLFENSWIAFTAVGVISSYVTLGGYLDLLKDGAVSSKKLPAHQRNRIEAAKTQLIHDVKSISGANISGLKLYLLPGDDEMNATAYGFKCVSITRGTLDNTDPITLISVLGHEISHIQSLDPEFNRAVFFSVMLLVGALSVISFSTVAIIFLIFFILSCFRSWLGMIAFQGTTKLVRGMFNFFQKSIVLICRVLMSCSSRASEFRADRYSAQLGYGVQLAHFLTYAAPESHRQLTLTEALYRTHPATPRRVARLEAFVGKEECALQQNKKEEWCK